MVAGIVASASGPAAHAAPSPDGIGEVPGRTALSFIYTPTGARVGTANQGEARPGLSIAKLYVVDYMLRHGDGSPEDLALGQRMIRDSDDGAAAQAYAKYPQSIDAIAAEYRLISTRGAGFWGDAVTSTADIVTFLEAKKTTDLDSPILGWMETAALIAADGTYQNWGTGQLPSVTGTKWGWSDYGPSVVASVSFGSDFVVAAHTYGSADQHTGDVLGAFVQDPASPQPAQVPMGDC